VPAPRTAFLCMTYSLPFLSKLQCIGGASTKDGLPLHDLFITLPVQITVHWGCQHQGRPSSAWPIHYLSCPNYSALGAPAPRTAFLCITYSLPFLSKLQCIGATSTKDSLPDPGCQKVCTVQVGIKCDLIWTAEKLCAVQICIQCNLIWATKQVYFCTVQVGIKCELIWAAEKLCAVQICIIQIVYSATWSGLPKIVCVHRSGWYKVWADLSCWRRKTVCCSGLYTVRPDLGCQKLCVCVCVFVHRFRWYKMWADLGCRSRKTVCCSGQADLGCQRLCECVHRSGWYKVWADLGCQQTVHCSDLYTVRPDLSCQKVCVCTIQAGIKCELIWTAEKECVCVCVVCVCVHQTEWCKPEPTVTPNQWQPRIVCWAVSCFCIWDGFD